MSSTFSDIVAYCEGDGDLSQILNNTTDLFQFNTLENHDVNQEEYADENRYQLVKQEDAIADCAEESGGKQPGQPFIISNEEYPGPYQFNVFIDPHHGSKSPWVFSASLNKVFIQMGQNFPVDFKWVDCDDRKLFVRATPVFSSQYQPEIVTRCIPHAQGNDKSNFGLEPHIWEHIIRCRHPNATYVGGKDLESHLSVVVPLDTPQTGADTVRHMYVFVCKNSCPTGMNRRQLEVIFTLEDISGRILGRRALNVRVCSCPKRDKDKEEREYVGVGVKNAPPPQSKKRKLEKKPPSFTETTVDTREYDINLKIIGKNNVNTILKLAHGLMAGEMARHNTEQPFKKCMLEIGQKMSGSASLSN